MKLCEEDGRLTLEEKGETLSWLHYDEEDGTVHVKSVHTAEGEEGQGYATELMEKAVPILERKGQIRNSCPFLEHWANKNQRTDVEATNLLEFKKAVHEFNRYHSPEAKAEITGYDRETITLLMTGPFCDTCGAYDYLEDIAHETKIEVKVAEHRQVEKGLEAVYRFPGKTVY